MKKTKLKFNTVSTCIVFLVMIFGLTLASLLKPVKAFSENENRYLAQNPKFSFESLFKGKFMKDYEEFITDQFVGRDSWIGLKTNMERAMLKQDINNVFFGKDNYLIEKHNASDIDKKVEQRNVKRLVSFTKYADKKIGNGKTKVIMVPTASEVFKDKLPPYAPGYDQSKFIGDVKSKLKKGKNNNNFVDIRKTMKNHNKEYIYYRTDHHWTSLGAYYAYKEWAKSAGIVPFESKEFNVKKVTDSFYGTIFSKVNTKVKADDINLYNLKNPLGYKVDYNMGERKSKSLYDMKKLKTKDKYSVFLGGNNALVQINTTNKNGKKLLVIKDSFAHSFVPFAANHFETTYMVDFRYFNMGMKQFMEAYEVTDVLILYNTINFAKDRHSSAFTR